MKRLKLALKRTACATGLLMLGVGGAQAEGTVSEALAAAKPIFESRLRFEDVNQTGIANQARALTLRNRFGFQTGAFHDLKALIEVDYTEALISDYNSNLNGKTAYPVVADPKVTEINRAQLTWTPSAFTTVVAGRQRIIYDDARFIGNVAWRSDEQTFDGLKFDTSFGKLKLSYAYITKVNRVLAEAKDFSSNSHLLNLTYAISEPLKLQAFDYNIRLKSAATVPTAADITNAKISSVRITGGRLTGNLWLSSIKLNYTGQYAEERNLGLNPASFKLSEVMYDLNATYDIYTFKANYEVLGGNGTQGFITPLGTTHVFQGWSDVFSAVGGNKTLANGIKDLTLGVTVAGHTKDWLPYVLNPTFSVFHHDFKTDHLSQSIGREWNYQFTSGITKNLALTLKYADFNRANTIMPASRKKAWVMLVYTL
jgi:hypothetical protein